MADAGVSVPEARFTTRYRDLLSAPDIDIISIATPNHLHAAQAVAAAKAGKHFLLEKPTGLDDGELKAIRNAVKRAGGDDTRWVTDPAQAHEGETTSP